MIANNYVIMLNHIGPDAMHYLADRISATTGVLGLLPCPTVNEDGKYKVLVHQKSYHRVRNHLKEVIPKWYDEFVEPDAKAPESRYPGPPEVSPIESDGDSQGDQTYMTISVKTAMSFGSNLSNESPPIYVYPKEQHAFTDASTIGGSQATSSINGRSWADTARGSRTMSSLEFKSSDESASQKAMKQDLAASREEVAQLKERLTKIESTRATEEQSIEDKVKQQVEKERKAMEEQVKQQVAQVLQEQLSVFTHQMTTMFAQMMILQQNDYNRIKRSAIQMQEEQTDEMDERFLQEDATKRRDHKATPEKTQAHIGSEKSTQWNTPDYLKQIASQPEWSESKNSHKGKPSNSTTISNKKGLKI